MLEVTLHPPTETEGIAQDFLRDGFVCVRDALTPEQLAYGQEGAYRCRRRSDRPYRAG